MNALLIGKGPTFIDRFRPAYDVCIAINEAALHVESVHYAVASDPLVAHTLRLWAPVKGFQLVIPSHLGPPGPHVTTMDALAGHEEWKTMTRREALDRQVLYTEGFSSTIAAWLAWMMGCTSLTTYGIGGEGYHPKFDGEPGHPQQGHLATDLLHTLADYKDMEISIQ